MKRATTILAAILLMAVGATAQKLSYSAVVRNSANELVANANITVAVSVTDGVNTYTESHAATTNANGLVTLTIGEGAGATGSLSGMNWPAASITATYTLPDGATVTNTVPVNAVPYALYAETAGSGGGIVTETDPTVPAWAKELTKPAYDYSEITGTPTIPTVNDGTLTIQKNGAEVGTFTANQSGNTTVNITITAQDIIDAVNGMTDAEKAALCSALNCGGGSEPSDPTAFTCGTSKMVDADGNEYETVLIGTQCWTKTNLRSTKAADGSAIPAGGSATSITDPYYYDYSSHSLPLATRGYLYNWPAANLVCPAGWHLPSDAEWTVMEQTQTSMDVTGSGWRGDHAGKLAGEGWEPSTTAGAPGNASDPDHNATGFSAVPAGGCFGSSFNDAGNDAYFWSSTQDDSGGAWYRYLYYSNAGVIRDNYGKDYGYSVRCLRD